MSEDDTEIIDNYSEVIIGKVEEGQLYLKARELFNEAGLAWDQGDYFEADSLILQAYEHLSEEQIPLYVLS